jgi:glucose/arabinose dehydrogenase
MRTQQTALRAAALLFCGVLAACNHDDPVGLLSPNSLGDQNTPSAKLDARCDADNGGLTLPNGFCAVVVARDLGRARHIAVRPNGDLYIAINNGPGDAIGGIIALRDTDGDGRADMQEKFGPTGGTGIAWHDGHLYFSPDDRVLRYAFTGDELVPTGGEVVIVSGLTAGGDHPRKAMAFDDDGNMYVNIASASNSCQEENRVDGSPGVDPCPELDLRAGIWRFDADGINQTMASGTRFATELRNMTALTVHPDDDMLYGVQHGRDQLFDNWPEFYDAEDEALLPAEELFRIESGKAYGWPYCYFDGEMNKKVLAPEYGGDGEEVGRCADREDPIAHYPAHWAPLSMLFYDGEMFRGQYRGALFIAWHGTRFDPALQPAGPGYNVTYTRWQAGAGGPVAQYEIFADGFAGGDPSPQGAAHRPVGLAVGPDGSLYITDDKGGWVWRVYYKN